MFLGKFRRLFHCLLLLAGLSVSFAVSANGGAMVTIGVGQDDTLLGLCRTHLEDPKDCRKISRLNRLKDPDLIHPRQKLLVPVELLKGVPLDGVVTFVKGEVFLEQVSGSQRRRVAIDELLHEGGRIVTGEDGVVEITYEDGSLFFLSPNSALELVGSRKKGDMYYLRDLRLRTGLIVNKIKRATGREQRFNIITPSAVAGARGTEFRVAVDTQDATRSEVLEGTVGVSAYRQDVAVGAGEGTLVRKGEPPLPPRKLLSPPTLVEPQAIYKTDPLPLRFTSVAAAVANRVSFARDRGMKDMIRERVVAPPDPFTIADVADGTYYLQARSIDEVGLEGVPSEPLPLVIRFNPRPPSLQAPVSGASLRTRDVGFQWLKVRDAMVYHLQIARDQAFATIVVDAGGIGDSSYQARDLEFGNYFFRVASQAVDGYEGDWSDPVRFALVPPPPVPAMAPPEQDEREIRIRVKGAGTGMAYRFQVARDTEFTDLLVNETRTEPEIVFPRPDRLGIYQVRSKCIDATGYEGTFSTPQSFEIKRRFSPWWYGVGAIGIVGLILGFAL